MVFMCHPFGGLALGVVHPLDLHYTPREGAHNDHHLPRLRPPPRVPQVQRPPHRIHQRRRHPQSARRWLHRIGPAGSRAVHRCPPHRHQLTCPTSPKPRTGTSASPTNSGPHYRRGQPTKVSASATSSATSSGASCCHHSPNISQQATDSVRSLLRDDTVTECLELLV